MPAAEKGPRGGSDERGRAAPRSACHGTRRRSNAGRVLTVWLRADPGRLMGQTPGSTAPPAARAAQPARRPTSQPADDSAVQPRSRRATSRQIASMPARSRWCEPVTTWIVRPSMSAENRSAKPSRSALSNSPRSRPWRRMPVSSSTPFVLHLPDLAGDVLVARRALPRLQPEQQADVARADRGGGLEQLAEARGAGRERGRAGEHVLAQIALDGPERLQEQVVLALEVVEDVARADAGARGDVGDPALGQALLDHHLDRGAHQRLLACGALDSGGGHRVGIVAGAG